VLMLLLLPPLPSPIAAFNPLPYAHQSPPPPPPQKQ